MNKKISARRARLHGKFREGKITWGSNYNTGKYVPWLNVNGIWLEQAGFRIGDQIEIDVQNNQLIIKNLSAEGDHRN